MLAYFTGTYVFKLVAPENKTPPEIGKMVEIFKKQSDGTWKVTADIWNRDAPTPAAILAKHPPLQLPK